MDTLTHSQTILLQAGQGLSFDARRGTTVICSEGEWRLAAPGLEYSDHGIGIAAFTITLRPNQAYRLTQGGIITIRAERRSQGYCVVPASLLHRIKAVLNPGGSSSPAWWSSVGIQRE